MNRTTTVPTQNWQSPAATWPEIISRYVAFIQVPSWRATVKSDGSEKRGCVSAEIASKLGEQMLRTVERLFPLNKQVGLDRGSTENALALLAKRQGRHISRDKRCSTTIGFHLRRALLFNDAGYTCCYCGRTAWGVYGEQIEGEERRTLRLEIDHRNTRRRLKDSTKFDPKNLVIACRSCNAIKAEMTVDRFLHELDSLASAVVLKRNLLMKTL
jgi:5-methylcytosine-specific restriction endonuclease McrA